RVVDEDAVSFLPVFTETLTVIGGHERDRAVERSPAREMFQQPRDLCVDEGDLTVIRTGREPLSVLRGRLVRGMRVEVVDPHEPGTSPRSLQPGLLVHPGGHTRGRVVRVTLRRTHAARTAARQPVVVNIEPPGKTKPA